MLILISYLFVILLFKEEIARAIPNAKLKIFAESGHLIRLDEPELLLEEITKFLNL